MYKLYKFGQMINDKKRTESYYNALKNSVTPDSIVVDIGSGTGIFSLMASKLGARHVYAIEPQENAYVIAQKLVKRNCKKNNITLIKDLSTNIELSELADIVVADVHGILPLFKGSVASLIDARERLLKPGGTIIPAGDVMHVAVVNLPEKYSDLSEPWGSDVYGFDFSEHNGLVVNELYRARLTVENLLSESYECAHLNYNNIISSNVQSSLQINIEVDGVAHGVGVWFDCILDENYQFSNAPDQEQLIYGQAFLPFENSVRVKKGYKIALNLDFSAVGGNYIWNWKSTIIEPGDNGDVIAEFDQSTFRAEPAIDLKELRKLAESHRPELTDNGEVTYSILSRMKGNKTLVEVAGEILMQHSETIVDEAHAMELVRQVSREFSL